MTETADPTATAPLTKDLEPVLPRGGGSRSGSKPDQRMPTVEHRQMGPAILEAGAAHDQLGRLTGVGIGDAGIAVRGWGERQRIDTAGHASRPPPRHGFGCRSECADVEVHRSE